MSTLQDAFNSGKSAIGFKIDYALWKKKTGNLLTQLIPFARVTARMIAHEALNIIKQATPNTKTGTDIRGMWELTSSKQAIIFCHKRITNAE